MIYTLGLTGGYDADSREQMNTCSSALSPKGGSCITSFFLIYLVRSSLTVHGTPGELRRHKEQPRADRRNREDLPRLHEWMGLAKEERWVKRRWKCWIFLDCKVMRYHT